LERNGLLGHLEDGADALDRHLHFVGDFLRLGSRPKSWMSCFCTRMSLLIVSIMWTGMRMVRAWSAMERVMAWRIHQVA
jgi:hypothetical protein